LERTGTHHGGTEDNRQVAKLAVFGERDVQDFVGREADFAGSKF
jgi:hypothetical protein